MELSSNPRGSGLYFWPKRDVLDTILADLRLIRMEPVSDFTRDSVISYGKYYAQIDLYLIKNKEMVSTVKESIIVAQFIANTSFQPNILNLATKQIKTMADCIVPINMYIQTQMDCLQYVSAPSMQVHNVKVQEKQVAKSRKKVAVGHDRTSCWNCEHLKRTDTEAHKFYWTCPFDCRSCQIPTCAGDYAGFIIIFLFACNGEPPERDLRQHSTSTEQNNLPK